MKIGILRPSPQYDRLFYPIGCKENRLLKDEWIVGIGGVDSHFYKNIEAVLSWNGNIGEGFTTDAIDVDFETGLCFIGKSDVGDQYTFTVSIVNFQSFESRTDSGEDRINGERIGRELQYIVGIIRK